jgi:hypothetical protein
MSESRVPATIEYATPIEFRRDALIVRSGRAAGLVFIVVGGFLLAFCGFLHWVDAEGPAVSFRNAVLLGTVSVAVGVGCLRHRRPAGHGPRGKPLRIRSGLPVRMGRAAAARGALQPGLLRQ